MAKILTDVDTFSADVTVPEGGDARTALSVELPFQKLSNRTRNLLNRLEGIGLDAMVPFLKSTDTAEEHPSESGNAWKLLMEFATGGAASPWKVRVFSGNMASLWGVLAISVNAKWDPTAGSAGEWSADDTGDSAVRLVFDNLRAVLVHKQTTSSAWTDSGWDLVGGTSLGAMNISGEYTYASGKTRKIVVPLVGYGSGWAYPSNDTLLLAANAGDLHTIGLQVPDGSTITRVRAIVDPISAAMTMQLIRRTSMNFGTPSAGSVSVLETETSSGGSLQTLDTGAISYTVDRDTQDYMVRFEAGTTNDAIYALEIEITDQGYRGHA